jgi:excinuclease ABC subunit A
MEGIEHIDKIIDIDQSPIGRTPRSNPATYTGVFTPIRDLFSQLPEAKVRGYDKGRFSFNVKGGRCEACSGDGIIKIEMHFLPDVYVPCEVCKGKRYNRETLEVKYKGKNIFDVLDMNVTEALEFFTNIPAIRRQLETLEEVGLGYIKLGQPSTQLSGGEAQRIKLASELSKRSTGKTMYILDEPTTGLHFADVDKLIQVLNRLADAGNTVVVIEHNLDVIKTADYIIDLGPDGGDRGGMIIGEGTPEEIAGLKNSYTGEFLKKVLR